MKLTGSYVLVPSRRSLGLLLLILLMPLLSKGQTKDSNVAKNLKGNVVRVKATWGSGSEENGFGFIVGERDKYVYIVTANHVVRSTDPDAGNRSIRVKYYFEQGQWSDAELLDTALDNKDLAVIRCIKPRSLAWEKKSLAREEGALSGKKVWFIGRTDTDDSWYVPTIPGSINSGPNSDSLLLVDINSVRVGTSGAPLVTETGIVGMIIADNDAAVAKALHIDVIRRAFEQWQYPWELQLGSVATNEDPISGKWNVFINGNSTPNGVLTLKLAGTRVTGEMKDENPSTPINDGSWIDSRLKLTIVDDEVTILLDGVLRGDEIIGTMNVTVRPGPDIFFQGPSRASFTAKKIK